MRWADLLGGTAFSRAAWNGDIEVMRLLLARGADPNVVTEKGETALLLLAGAGWPLGQGYIRSEEEITAALDLLVEEFGMDVNAATTEGITPVIGAIFKGDNFVVQYLVDHGARLDVKDAKGRGVIAWAQGIAANEGQPPRPQPETEKLVRELMAKQGITIAMRNSRAFARRVADANKKAAALGSDGLVFCEEGGTLLLEVELDVDGDVLRDPARVVPAFADVEVEAVDGHGAGELRRGARAGQRELQRHRLRRALQRELTVRDVRAVGGLLDLLRLELRLRGIPWR